MTDAQTEARAIAPLTLEGAIWHYMDEKTVAAYGPWITKADHDTALAAKDAELAEVHQRYVDANEARIDAEAALAERAGGVKVKALEWEKRDVWYAKCPVSGKVYLIAEEEGRFWPLWDASLPGYNTIEAAKAAAQADYERRILSCLTTEPAAPEGRQEAVACIGDAVLDWMVKFDLLDAGNEYYVSDVLAVLNDLTPSTRPSEQAVTEAARRVLEWVYPIAGDNRDEAAAKEEIDSVEALKAAMEAGR